MSAGVEIKGLTGIDKILSLFYVGDTVSVIMNGAPVQGKIVCVALKYRVLVLKGASSESGKCFIPFDKIDSVEYGEDTSSKVEALKA